MFRQINKDLDDLKSPSNRLLVWILLAAVSVLFTMNNQDRAEELDDCHKDRITLIQKNDSLHRTLVISEENKRLLEERLIRERDSTTEQLRMNKEYLDNLARELKKIVNKK